jgi:class 3 adenylate cyclase
MEDLATWLQGLGLALYAQRFAENDITFAILSDLTDQDLKELGVSSLGHRRQLLRAIAEQKNHRNIAPRAAVRPVGVPNAEVQPATRVDAAERRQLTVVFCDLVGSTALSARFDPEDMREIIASYQRCCATAIIKAGGFVAKYMGDGVLAYFGYRVLQRHIRL